MDFLKKDEGFVLTFAAFLISIIAWIISYSLNLVTAYNDSMSHLNLSRFVVDNIKTGLSQIGGVWLPLSHLLALPLIKFDWAWHSGFAGSIVSMISFTVSVLTVYKIVKEITGRGWAAIIGSLAFAFNLNILYLQTTPLTEPLYLIIFLLSVFFFVKWLKQGRAFYLPILGALGFFQVLTRYDGWFVVIIEGLLILLYLLFSRKEKFSDSLGRLILYALPVFLGVGLWLLWNLLIFNDPLFFAFGPYSAHAQQEVIENKAGLIMKGNLPLSFLAFFFAVLNNVGTFVVLTGLLGLYVFFNEVKHFTLSQKTLFLLMLFSPIIFNILALYLGFSILNTPELNWNPSSDPAGQWFNVRYGILALPAFAVLAGFAVSKKKLDAVLGLIIIIAQVPIMYNQGIITIEDGTVGSSSFTNGDISQKLAGLVNSDDKILMSTSFFNAVAFKSGKPLKQFIHEGVDYWGKAVVYPEDYATWLVMANGDVGEPLYTSLIKNQQGRFLAYYELIYKGEHADIYVLKPEQDLFVAVKESELILGSSPFKAVGVNSYDLAYKSKEEIVETFRLLQTAGVNTVRFWAFGDGFPEGFQPRAGTVNKERFDNLDYIISLARQHHIRLIIVLTNNWQDYGGKEQYLLWTGNNPETEILFYQDVQVKELFKNYINKVVSRHNLITQTDYVNDPSILAWEIINEPRLNEGDVQLIADWTEEIAAYIKTIDKNHLVSVGTERVISQELYQPNLCGGAGIDLCSLHLYLYIDNNLIFSNRDHLEEFIVKQIEFAKAENKPLLLGELGLEKYHQPFGDSPVNVLEKIVDYADLHEYAGYLVWNWSLESDDNFGFSPQGKDSLYSLQDLQKVLN